MKRLPQDDTAEDARASLDSDLRTLDWWLSRRKTTTRHRSPDIPSDAPSWWEGEQDASDSFLKAMGVTLQ